jgi:phosphoribosylaminoimidazolecarboxamide formyltransferase/IMP cyclohydrolase
LIAKSLYVIIKQQARDIMESIEIKEIKELSFGENIEQKAGIAPVESGIEYEILSDCDDLEYIDYLNLSKAIEILAEFFDVNAAAVARENQLCSVALGSSLENAFEKISDCDPMALVGGTIGFTKEVNEEIAKLVVASKIRNIISTKFSKNALEYFLKNGEVNVIVVKSPLQELLGFETKDIKVTPFGYLIQEQNLSKLTKSSFKVATKTKPTQQQAEDAIFAWKIAKYVKSKSAVIAKDLATKAIIQAQTNGIDGVEAAMDLSCENSKEAVLAVDGVIENEEVINAAIQGRIGTIIEASNGSNSDKISKLADKYNIALIATGIRNNRY